MALTIQRLRMSRNTPLPPHTSYGMLCYGVTFTITTLGFFPWAGEVDHSSPSSAEVESEWSYSLFPVYAFIASVRTITSYLLYAGGTCRNAFNHVYCPICLSIFNKKYGNQQFIAHFSSIKIPWRTTQQLSS